MSGKGGADRIPERTDLCLRFPAFGHERDFGRKVGKLNGRKWQKAAVLEEKFPTRGCREIIGLLQGIPQKKQGTGLERQ